MMTSQQQADAALREWQALRELPPEVRIEALMKDFFLPPIELDNRYRDALDAVAVEMAR